MRPYLACFSFDFDYARLEQEVSQYIPDMIESGPAKRFKDVYAPCIDVSHFDGNKIIKGSVKGHSVYSLTYVPELEYSGYGFNMFRSAMESQSWNWRPNLDYTRSVVESLPMDWYRIVKVLYLPKGGAGVRHTDSNFDDNDSITLEILQGGVLLNIYPDNEKEPIQPSTRCFFFDDGVLHGVGTPISSRLLLRVHGKLSPNALDLAVPGTTRYLRDTQQ